MNHDWIPVEGNSMRPFLNPGDFISVDWKHPQSPSLGDLVLGKSGELWIIHRMIGMKNKNFLIKGDASFVCEEMTENEIWGKVIAWKKSGTDRIFTHNKNSLDIIIALLGRYEFRRCAKFFGLLKRLNC